METLEGKLGKKLPLAENEVRLVYAGEALLAQPSAIVNPKTINPKMISLWPGGRRVNEYDEYGFNVQFGPTKSSKIGRVGVYVPMTGKQYGEFRSELYFLESWEVAQPSRQAGKPL